MKKLTDHLSHLSHVLSLIERTFAYHCIINHIERNGADFADNFRATRVGDVDGEEEFLKQCVDGCCGSEQFYVEWNDVQYALGYNHGH